MFTFFNDFDILSDEKITLKVCEKFQGNDVLLPFYYYDIYDNGTGERIGKISIRIGHNYHSYYNGHIGYEIDEPYRGNSYSYHGIRLVVAVARAHQMKSLYLTCKVSNVASRKIIERTHATFQEVAKIPRDCFFWCEGIEDYCIYLLRL